VVLRSFAIPDILSRSSGERKFVTSVHSQSQDGRISQMTLLYMDDRFLTHETGQHPECPQRLRSIHEKLKTSGLLTRVTRRAVRAASDADILRVHTAEHLQAIRDFAAAGGGRIEVDTVMSRASADVAAMACGAAVDAVERVIAGESTTAFCVVRPPGHHALPDRAMGFCLLGNAAIAARAAIQRLGLDRVLIVDWDVHHGNGTQDVFYDDPQVGFFSAHRFPFYPGTGRKSETGSGEGLGTTFNLPLAFGISRKEYLTAFESLLTKAADIMKPELVILSAGFDAHVDDPVGSLSLETEDFGPLTNLVKQVAATHAKGRLVSVLEGGYNVERLADCVELHLNSLIE
jgi:acetoin utilization deacetylase AcuC-like enzyme